MKTIKKYNQLKIPEYALPCLVSNDWDNITEDDEKNINNFMKKFYNKAKKVGGDVIFSTEKDESYFSWHPEFGLACNVIDCTILIVK